MPTTESIIIKQTFEQRLLNGGLTEESARAEQERKTGNVVERDGEAFIIDVHGDKMSLDNLAAVIRWAESTGGLVYVGEGNERKLLTGQTVDEILAKKE